MAENRTDVRASLLRAALRAVLAARIGMAAFVQATLAWLDDPGPGLGERLDLALAELNTLLGQGDP